jgi:uncharacterized protein (DUF924 family)
MSVTPESIVEFWLNEVGEAGWYKVDPDLDATIRKRFLRAWRAAKTGAFDDWLIAPASALALVILLDQFPRNMFRGSGEAFSSDEKALRLAKLAVSRGHDMKVEEPARQFFYLPLMHSENLQDQDRCARLMKCRMPETGRKNLPHACAHRAVIREFGRFPYRNDALGRETSGEERDYLAAGGYAHTMKKMAATAA